MSEIRATLAFVCCLACLAQDRSFVVTGEIRGDDVQLMSDLVIELYSLERHIIVAGAVPTYDGHFEFRDVPFGFYRIRIISALHRQTILEDLVQINSGTPAIVLQLPKVKKARPVSGIVSASELAHPIPKKAHQAFLDAGQYSRAGKPDKAIEKLRLAVRIHPGYRDAHGNLGFEYALTRRYGEALQEFQEAIRIGPDSAILRTNLAYAWFGLGRFTEAETAAREAVKLDPRYLRGHFLLGQILMAESGKDAEALEHFRLAAPELPRALVLSADIQIRMGQRQAAIAGLREYLKIGAPEDRSRVETWLSQLEPDERAK